MGGGVRETKLRHYWIAGANHVNILVFSQVSTIH
jgi:hypothetical protein